MKTGKTLRDTALLEKHAKKPRTYVYPPLPKGQPVTPQQKEDEAERLRLQRHEDSKKQREYTHQKHELYDKRKAELADKTEWFTKTFLTLMRATHKIRDRKEALLEARRLVEKRNELQIDIQRLTNQTRRQP